MWCNSYVVKSKDRRYKLYENHEIHNLYNIQYDICHIMYVRYIYWKRPYIQYTGWVLSYIYIYIGIDTNWYQINLGQGWYTRHFDI